MGQRIRSARQAAGLSQNQLSEGLVTRNMLSQIENGSAKPSLSTLEAIASRLKKPVGYFFGEEGTGTPERAKAEEAWEAWKAGDALKAARILDHSQVSFSDIPILKTLILLELSRKAIAEKREPYAREMLQWIDREQISIPALQRQMLLMMGQLEGQKAEPICSRLPSLDTELRLRAEGALEAENPERAGALLDASEDRESPGWNLLRGKVYVLQKDYRSAAACFHRAEEAFPGETAALLELCYRELEDYKQAYFYACRQK